MKGPSDGVLFPLFYPFIQQTCSGRRITKAQVIIRRPAIAHKSQIRAHIFDDIVQEEDQSQVAGPSTRETDSSMDMSPSSSRTAGRPDEFQDELSRIRQLLHPPPISGVDDWGIPPESSEPCDSALYVCYLIQPFNILFCYSDFFYPDVGKAFSIFCFETRPRESKALQRFSHV